MRDLIKKILREEVNKRFIRGTDAAKSIIIKHMEKIISNTTRVTPPTEENYGNYNEEWCKGDKIIMEARYYFNSDEDDESVFESGDKFFAGDLYIDKGEIDYLSKMLQVRKTFILNVITEWYDEKYTTKFGQEIGHPEIEIDETHESDSMRKCYQMVNTDNLSRGEMINYLHKNSLYRISELEDLSDYDLKSRYRSVYNIKSNDI